MSKHPATTDNGAFDEEHELALIELQQARFVDKYGHEHSEARRRTDEPKVNLRRILAEQRRLLELRELIDQVRRETAPQREIGGAP